MKFYIKFAWLIYLSVSIDAYENRNENCLNEWELTKFNMIMAERKTIDMLICVKDKIMETLNDDNWSNEFVVKSENENLVHIIQSNQDLTKANSTFRIVNITLEAIFLGRTRLYIDVPQKEMKYSQYIAEIIIKRPINHVDVLYKIILAIFVIVLYMNFGAAVRLDALQNIILKPIGPAIGLIGQFLIMPILSYLIGFFLFRDEIELRLGLFFTGSTPGGSVSNIFTVLLNGNLDLSITMTALSNLAAFGMMPFWLFTLGSLIFHDGQLLVPYQAIAVVSCSLIFPLTIGILMQRYCCPQVARKITKFLKPISMVSFIVITTFAFTVNSFIFRLFSWKIMAASCMLPWLGYCLGWLMAKLFKQTPNDALTIAIETGIQNTGIAIFMLNFTLPQPQADITSAVPVANSMLAPLPLLIIYIGKRILRYGRNEKGLNNENNNT